MAGQSGGDSSGAQGTPRALVLLVPRNEDREAWCKMILAERAIGYIRISGTHFLPPFSALVISSVIRKDHSTCESMLAHEDKCFQHV